MNDCGPEKRAGPESVCLGVGVRLLRARRQHALLWSLIDVVERVCETATRPGALGSDQRRRACLIAMAAVAAVGTEHAAADQRQGQKSQEGRPADPAAPPYEAKPEVATVAQDKQPSTEENQVATGPTLANSTLVRLVCVARAAATELAHIPSHRVAAGAVHATRIYMPGDVVTAYERRVSPHNNKVRVRTGDGWISLVATDGTVLFVPDGYKVLSAITIRLAAHLA
eukprot:SAG31_NODE_771_length_12216_cov_5.603862_2_plen_227_part_00